MRYKILLVLILASATALRSQLKYVIEDFEGLSNGTNDLKANGIFVYGNSKAAIEKNPAPTRTYTGDRFMKVTRDFSNPKITFGGWGKGVGMNIVIDPQKDVLNFYVLQSTNDTCSIKIELQEDDNANKTFEKDDDSWIYHHKFEKISDNDRNTWRLVSIPLSKFKDNNYGGDGVMNINYKEGRLISVLFSFPSYPIPKKSGEKFGLNELCFDFISISQGKLPTSADDVRQAKAAASGDQCNLGAWSKEGNTANFAEIATNFENCFKSEKKLGVVHFFQPFAFDGGTNQNLIPSVERINKVTQSGYIPMITLENHFVNSAPGQKQPNLYSIVEGHFDSFFKDWANQIKQVKGTVLLRILHEFNGDWYPWCIVNNDRNPSVFINAYRRIHSIFTSQGVTNVKFIWCPNSLSIPQEPWNYIMDAYPGDEYVDYLGLDVYNGAGKGLQLWRSFRKEGIENYFLLTQLLPDKPLFICETASRERGSGESLLSQSKSEWIQQMSEAVKTDMSKIRLLAWFNEKETFRINSTSESQTAFLNHILKSDYFKSGTKDLKLILQR